MAELTQRETAKSYVKSKRLRSKKVAALASNDMLGVRDEKSLIFA